MSERLKSVRPNSVASSEELPETILLTAEELRALEAATTDRAARPTTHSRAGTTVGAERSDRPSSR